MNIDPFADGCPNCDSVDIESMGGAGVCYACGFQRWLSGPAVSRLSEGLTLEDVMDEIGVLDTFDGPRWSEDTPERAFFAQAMRENSALLDHEPVP